MIDWAGLEYCGSIPFRGDAPASTLPAHLAECLRRVHGWYVAVNGNRVTFRGGWLRGVSGLNILNPFGYGEVEVDASGGRIRYRLRLTQLIVVATGAIGLLGVVGLCTSFSGIGLAVFLLVAWTLLVPLNLLIGIRRFEAFLRRAVSEIREDGDSPLVEDVTSETSS